MVDAAVERDGPAAVEDTAVDGDFEFGGGGVFSGSERAELLVPVSAELGAPEAVGAAGGIAGAEGEVREFADAQAGRAGVEGIFHSGLREHAEGAEGKWKVREGTGPAVGDGEVEERADGYAGR